MLKPISITGLYILAIGETWWTLSNEFSKLCICLSYRFSLDWLWFNLFSCRLGNLNVLRLWVKELGLLGWSEVEFFRNSWIRYSFLLFFRLGGRVSSLDGNIGINLSLLWKVISIRLDLCLWLSCDIGGRTHVLENWIGSELRRVELITRCSLNCFGFFLRWSFIYKTIFIVFS